MGVGVETLQIFDRELHAIIFYQGHYKTYHELSYINYLVFQNISGVVEQLLREVS